MKKPNLLFILGSILVITTFASGVIKGISELNAEAEAERQARQE